jgi:hypothetical protein
METTTCTGSAAEAKEEHKKKTKTKLRSLRVDMLSSRVFFFVDAERRKE